MLRIHVAAVGFEVDRIVMPAVNMRADKVWLIVHDKPFEDKGASFGKEVEKELANSKITYRSIAADRTDLFDTLRAFNSIIMQEKVNAIYVNVSAGSKIQSIAAMMACMMFKDDGPMIRPYYVVPEKYTTEPKEQETKGVKEIIDLPEYKVETPSENLIRCMAIIEERGNKISKKELKDRVLSLGLIKVVGKDGKPPSEQAPFMALNKNLLEPLMKWGFITISKVGSHNIVELAPEGSHALKFLKVRLT